MTASAHPIVGRGPRYVNAFAAAIHYLRQADPDPPMYGMRRCAASILRHAAVIPIRARTPVRARGRRTRTARRRATARDPGDGSESPGPAAAGSTDGNAPGSHRGGAVKTTTVRGGRRAEE